LARAGPPSLSPRSQPGLLSPPPYSCFLFPHLYCDHDTLVGTLPLVPKVPSPYFFPKSMSTQTIRTLSIAVDRSCSLPSCHREFSPWLSLVPCSGQTIPRPCSLLIPPCFPNNGIPASRAPREGLTGLKISVLFFYAFLYRSFPPTSDRC